MAFFAIPPQIDDVLGAGRYPLTAGSSMLILIQASMSRRCQRLMPLCPPELSRTGGGKVSSCLRILQKVVRETPSLRSICSMVSNPLIQGLTERLNLRLILFPFCSFYISDRMKKSCLPIIWG
jgi:hypothetical protein